MHALLFRNSIFIFNDFVSSRDVIEVALCRCILFSHARVWTVHIVYGLNKRETFRAYKQECRTPLFYLLLSLV